MGDSFSTIIVMLIVLGLMLLCFILMKRVRSLESKVQVLWEYGENIKKIHANFDKLCEEMKKLAEVQVNTVNSYASLCQILQNMQEEKRIADNARAYNAAYRRDSINGSIEAE